jgi:curli biogenesis system outer membrane secretion channel CsgG
MGVGAMRRMFGTFCAASVAASMACGGIGCGGAKNHWSYNTPPTAAGATGPEYRDPSRKRVVVVGDFDNPTRQPLAWKDVGKGMAKALGDAILNRGEFDVWVDARFADRVERAVYGPVDARPKKLRELQDENELVRYVIIGQVTDFHHTHDVGKEMSRRSFWGHTNEAIVAIQFNVVDMDTQRVVIADHVFGTADATRAKTASVYEDVGFGSYLFWNSPLGRASEVAIDNAMVQLNRLVPTKDETLRIVSEAAGRQVKIAGGPHADFLAGEEYFVCLQPDMNLPPTPVVDPLTRKPIKARVARSARVATEAILWGEKPLSVDLRGAVLLRVLPPGAVFDEADRMPAAEVNASVARHRDE